MSLPGKLCIGILEEDNPLKSYFCFKPLLVEENDRYVPFESRDVYPENGCIRIVPDKNESSHFKARMRRIGLFAVVDLRGHPNDNDKIRPNKNYHGDGTESNAHIIYSDVVRELAPGTVFSLLELSPEEAENALLKDEPSTQKLLLYPEGELQESVWTYEADEVQSDNFRLHAADETVKRDELQVFELQGFGERMLNFAILPPDQTVIEPIVRPGRSVPEPVHEQKIVTEAPRQEGSEQETEPPKAAETPEQPEASEEPNQPEEPDKPWIVRTDVFAAPRIDPALPSFERSLAAQSGLNPKRGRSLQEIIDEKWKHSRIDQLGHAVQGVGTDAPVVSPAEQAVAALRDAWSCRDQRETLVDAIVRLEGAQIAMDARRSAIKQSAVNDQLNELEAQRLQMLNDLEVLKRKGDEVKECLKKEIRRDEAEAFAEAIQKTERAQAEQARWESEADQARAAAKGVEDALNALADGTFEGRLREFAINSSAVEMLRRLDAPQTVEPLNAGEAVTADDLVRRLRACSQDAGYPISQTYATNLLICAAQGPVIFSGAPGSGKTAIAQQLARALGVEGERFALIPPGKESLADRPKPKGEAVSMVLLDDMNLMKTEDPMRGLWPLKDGTVFCATVQDDGYMLNACMLSRSFLLRLSDESADAPWTSKPVSVIRSCPLVSADALRQAFGPKLSALPVSVTKRMEKLRADLALLGIKLSRGTLNVLWRYCAAAIPLMPLEPSAVLDLALAQRALPAIVAGAPLDALKALAKLLSDLPRCKALLDLPLPIEL